MKVKDVMTTEVRRVGEDATLKEAAALMADLRISGLPVVRSDGHVVGVVSEGDILFKETGPAPKAGLVVRLFSLPAPELAAKLEARTVGESMTSPAVTIGPDRPVTEAASLMLDKNVKRLPVVDASGKLVGIVSRADLVRAFVRSDEEIAREIREEVLRRTLWLDPVLLKVVVEHGDVRLEGQVENQAEAEIIPRVVQRVPGVVSVLAKLHWPEDDHHRDGRGSKAVWQRR